MMNMSMDCGALRNIWAEVNAKPNGEWDFRGFTRLRIFLFILGFVQRDY